MIQIVLNHTWPWASDSQRIWYYSPVSSMDEAQWQTQELLQRGVACVSQIGLACPLKSRPSDYTI